MSKDLGYHLGMYKLTLLILVLLFHSACGKKGVIKTTSETATISESQIQEIMDRQAFECASLEGGPCPEGISRLFIINRSKKEKSKLCTGFMMGPDILITNHHCVSNQAECNNTHIAIYRGDGYDQNRCASIVRFLSDGKQAADPAKALDVTVMRLQKKFRGKTLRPSETSVQAGDRVTGWIIDHTGNEGFFPNYYDSRITEVRCEATPTPGYASLILSSCPIIRGNSGAPALDKNGDVVGVIWGGNSSAKAKDDLRERRALKANASVTLVEHFIKFLRP